MGRGVSWTPLGRYDVTGVLVLLDLDESAPSSSGYWTLSAMVTETGGMPRFVSGLAASTARFIELFLAFLMSS